MQRGSVVIVLCGLLLLPLAVPSPAESADDLADRQAAAQAYVDATGGFAVQLDATIGALATQLPAEHQAPFVRFMQNALDPAEIEGLAVAGMARHFTQDELNALAAFYGSPLGRSITAKFPTYFAETMGELHALVIERAKAFEP